MADHRKATGNGLVYFNHRQLITVSLLFVAGFVVVFFLGVLIGQSVEERKLLRTEGQAVRVPVGFNPPVDDLKLDFHKTLTTPKPTPTPWTVQVFASRSRAKADGLVESLRQQGYGAYAVSLELEGKTFYRVRVGRYGSRRETLPDLQRLKAADFEDAEIRRN